MNHFEYFSEIEERFSRRRGSILLLSTMDWALIETWREAGIPLEAVLRGIDVAFDKYEARAQKTRQRKINGLAWCAQAVMQSAEEMVEAATGVAPVAHREERESGFEAESVAAYLDRNADALEVAADETALKTAQRVRELASAMRGETPIVLDELDRTLTVLEEKLFAALQAAATEQELVTLREQAERELAPYRAKISAVQLRQIQQQFLHKRLMEQRGLPRLSLFYMGHGE
jgi:hypothetical protein